MRDSPRIRRLRTDRRALEQLRSESSILDFVCHGDPAESYLIRFYGKGLWRPDGSPDILMRDQHEVAIRLGASYPRMMPELSWKTPIFHPNISGSGVVCLGGYGTYWVPSLNLDELCIMLWDMIRYQNFDIESPYNREAAQWARTQGTFRFPLDQRSLRDKLATTPRAVVPPAEQPKTLELDEPAKTDSTPGATEPSDAPSPIPIAQITPGQPVQPTAASLPVPMNTTTNTEAPASDEDVIFLDETHIEREPAKESDDNDILYIE